MNPWSVELCSCSFIQRIKSVSLLLLGEDFILRGSVSDGESKSFQTLSLFLCPISCYLYGFAHDFGLRDQKKTPKKDMNDNNYLL